LPYWRFEPVTLRYRPLLQINIHGCAFDSFGRAFDSFGCAIDSPVRLTIRGRPFNPNMTRSLDGLRSRLDGCEKQLKNIHSEFDALAQQRMDDSVLNFVKGNLAKDSCREWQ